MLSALFFLVPRMKTFEEQDFDQVKDSRNRGDQLSSLMTETRHRTLYGNLSLAQRIDLEKRNLHHCMVDAVKNKKRKPAEVMFELGLYCLPFLCRRVDANLKWQYGALNRQRVPSVKPKPSMNKHKAMRKVKRPPTMQDLYADVKSNVNGIAAAAPFMTPTNKREISRISSKASERPKS